MPPRIAILTGSHLCHNPRVFKEAAALAAAGYEVEVHGGWSEPALKARDREMMPALRFRLQPVYDLTRQPFLRFGLRARGRMARLLNAGTGRQNHWQLGPSVARLEKAARRSKADLLIAHSEPALWALSRRGPAPGPLGVDMEDWFSADLPPAARAQRPVRLLRRLEEQLLREAAHTTCTSRALSDALAAACGCRPPAVVYNAFPWSDRHKLDGESRDRRDRSLPSLHWYSQTLGVDRGLEDLFAALPLLETACEIHLRGRPVRGFEEGMMQKLPPVWRKRVFLHPLVSNDELLSRIAEHDLGFAGEQKHCPSRDLTITNKILHYLLAGLGVVASDTAGHREVAAQAPGAVRLYPAGDAPALAAALNGLLTSPGALKAARAAALQAAEQTFCWERQAPVLLASVHRALS